VFEFINRIQEVASDLQQQQLIRDTIKQNPKHREFQFFPFLTPQLFSESEKKEAPQNSLHYQCINLRTRNFNDTHGDFAKILNFLTQSNCYRTFKLFGFPQLFALVSKRINFCEIIPLFLLLRFLHIIVAEMSGQKAQEAINKALKNSKGAGIGVGLLAAAGAIGYAAINSIFTGRFSNCNRL
jgi:hypothetical protein